MVSAINSALSGLAAATKRIEVSANNVANQYSTKTKVDGQTIDKPFIPQRVDQVTIAGGGIESKIRDAHLPTVKIYDPGNPDADANGQLEVPNVDQAEELINQRVASYDYQANLKTIKIQNNIEKSLLDILA